MLIKFTCPHCKRGLAVKEAQAGKRGTCPACKKPLVIPNGKPAAPAVDLEALAAAALVDQPKPAPPPEDNRTIDFTCPYCDAPVKVGFALAGKNAPCPDCRRIVKVPVPAQEGPKDWRKADTRPIGAKREELEGAWGSTTSTGAVSQQALVEAEAVPEAVEPTPLRRRIFRGVAVTACVCLVVGVVLLALHLRTRSAEEKAIKKALDSVAATKSPVPAVAAEVHRGAGEFYARANKAAEAQKQLDEALGLVVQLADVSERDLLLIDLALVEVDLGGEKPETTRGTRLKWEAVQKKLIAMLSAVRSSRARVEGTRLVGRKLIARGQEGMAIELVRNTLAGDDLSEGYAELGLEMVRAKQNEHAAVQAEFAQRPFEAPARGAKKEGQKPNPGARPALPPSLIALWYALGKPEKAEKLGANDKIPQKLKTTPPEVAAGYVAGLAWQGKGQEALAVAQKMEPSLYRLEAVADLATALATTGAPDAAKVIQDALLLTQADAPRAVREAANLRKTEAAARRDKVSWLVLRLVREAVQAGVGKDALQEVTVPTACPDAAGRGRARLEVLLGQLRASKAKVEETAADGIDKESLAHGLAWEAIARHNAGHGDKSVTTVDAWPDEALRPFGYIGLALGVQDR